MTSKKDAWSDLPVVLFKEQGAWQAWLSTNHSLSRGVWLRLSKKASNLKTLSYQEALEAALCYGWIDGQKKSYDEVSWIQRFGRRGPRSIWSKINRSKAETLIRQGRMHRSGLQAIDRAKETGQWERAYDSQKTAIPATDFEKALKGKPEAKSFFEHLDSRNRYAILFRIHNAKKQETRQRRIEKFIEMLEKHERIYP